MVGQCSQPAHLPSKHDKHSAPRILHLRANQNRTANRAQTDTAQKNMRDDSR